MNVKNTWKIFRNCQFIKIWCYFTLNKINFTKSETSGMKRSNQIYKNKKTNWLNIFLLISSYFLYSFSQTSNFVEWYKAEAFNFPLKNLTSNEMNFERDRPLPSPLSRSAWLAASYTEYCFVDWSVWPETVPCSAPSVSP